MQNIILKPSKMLKLMAHLSKKETISKNVCFYSLLSLSGGIGFNVALSSSQSGAGKINFNIIKTNYGSGWKSALKRFVAPCTGLYWFQLSVMNGAKGTLVYAHLMHGTNILQKAWADGHDRYHLSTAAAVVRMAKGSFVEARIVSGTAFSNSNHWTNLVGYMIQSL